MNIDISEVLQYIDSFIYPFCRVIGFFLFAPIFNFVNIYNKVKIGIALIITFALVPVLSSNYNAQVELFSYRSFILMALEFIVGVSIGFIMQMFFQLFLFAGKITASQSFLSFAEVNESSSGIGGSDGNVPLLGQIYLIMVYLIYLSLDGHLLIINILQSSFNDVNVASLSIDKNIFWKIVSFGYYIFAGGLLLALPAICALLIVNITFGIVTKVAPQFNLFAVGFPAILIIGLLVFIITLGGISDFFIKFSDDILNIINSIFS
tara:strand:- start:5259 stop:6050 length:792 start_codon:yes stop_codon:yes gene_type:complete